MNLMKWFGKPVVSGSQRRRRSASVASEDLESRLLLTISWINEASSGFNVAERAVINEAIDDWEEAIPSFGPGGYSFSATISEGGVSDIARTDLHVSDAAGIPSSARVRIDINAFGIGHYVDPVPQDDAEFSYVDSFLGQGSLNGFDLYTTATRHLGEALGFDPAYSRFANQMYYNGFDWVFDGTSQDVIMTNDREYIDDSLTFQQNQLMGPGFTTGQRGIVSPLELEMLEDAFSYNTKANNIPNTFHTNFNSQTRDVVVTGTDGDDVVFMTAGGSGATIIHSDLEFDVNGFVEWYDNVSDVEVNTLDGADEITHQSQLGAWLYDDGPLDSYVLNSGDGNDEIQIYYPFGATLSGGEGRDSLTGGEGADSIVGGDGNDSLIGLAGNDTVRGDLGNDTLYGGDGNDSLTGGGNNDSVFGEDGNDTVQGNYGKDTLVGGDGNDSLAGGGGNDLLQGQFGADTIRGGSGRDTALGGAGNDYIDTDSGHDSVQAGSGNDTIYGGTGNDTLNGSNDHDLIYGEDDMDLIYGGNHRDTIYGGNGNDQVYGGTPTADSYIDLVFGGSGMDSSFSDPLDIFDSVENFGGFM